MFPATIRTTDRAASEREILDEINDLLGRHLPHRLEVCSPEQFVLGVDPRRLVAGGLAPRSPDPTGPSCACGHGAATHYNATGKGSRLPCHHRGKHDARCRCGNYEPTL
jgi:hypothetical protein